MFDAYIKSSLKKPNNLRQERDVTHMKWTGLNELREQYLSFFESKAHLRLPSFSLMPHNDNSLLLINSGMAPMKKYFTGEITPPSKRVTTCQKCIRTPDIERVGKTARHGTYFEMLGNFSFGDYFKKEATRWAWEFCTKTLDLPVDKLWVSIYLEDDEAFDIWTKEVGVSPDRIVRLGKADNFWEHGSGPCGPCSEIYFDRGVENGCDSPDCAVGCDCDRYVEFWNLVFTQFSNDGQNNYAPLEHPNIDTGMGLERLACIMQGVDNLFEVDTVANIMKHISKIAGVTYKENEKTDVSLRVVTDHIRSTSFMICDGVMPDNEGRGYVLKRLLRRAARHGRLLGIEKPFLSEVVDTVVAENLSAYPELGEKKELIKKVVKNEEESFGKTIDQGLSLLNTLMENAKNGVVSGEDAFKLYDTYGFPLDLTVDVLSEKGMTVDEEAFHEKMKEQRERARAGRKAEDKEAWAGEGVSYDSFPATDFTGYTGMVAQTKVLALIKNGQLVDAIQSGDKATVVLEASAFYAESGGQTGDKGVILSNGGSFNVQDTQKSHNGVILHKGTMQSGSFSVGEAVEATVDTDRRGSIMRNHTAAHLLQAALRQVLGDHVEQRGQSVDDRMVRFDFTHFSGMTKEELQQTELLVNQKILAALTVTMTEMPIEDAKKMGAMALFGEKYGDTVRVVQADGFSTELCGGTHVDNTARLGLFKIMSESSIASGVRRIEGVTGAGVLQYMENNQALLEGAAEAMKLNGTGDLIRRAAQMVTELRQKDREIESLNSKLAAGQIQSILQSGKEVKGMTLVTACLKNTGSDALRTMCDRARDENPNIVIVIAGINEGKANFAAAVGKEALKKGAHAGNIVREVAKITGSGGGGRPDSAMAGVKDIQKIEEALGAVEGLL